VREELHCHLRVTGVPRDGAHVEVVEDLRRAPAVVHRIAESPILSHAAAMAPAVPHERRLAASSLRSRRRQDNRDQCHNGEKRDAPHEAAAER